MYDFKALLEKEPAVIASTVRTLLMLGVLTGGFAAVGLNVDENVLAGVALALEAVLLLFVRHTVTPVAAPTLSSGTEVKVQGTEETVLITSQE